MVITFTEEQKRQIENAGMSVIQFKKMYYSLHRTFIEIYNTMLNNPDLKKALQEITDADT